MPITKGDITAAGGVLASGLGSLGSPTGTQTNTNTTTNQSGESSGNQNTFTNEQLSTFLSQLVNAFSNSQTQGSSATNFNLDPSTKALIDKLTAQYSNLSTPFNSQAYAAQQTQGINRNADIQKQAVDQIMASRGVSGPAAATAATNVENARFGNIVNMEQMLPFLANDYNKANLGAAAGFMSMIPKGTTTSTSGTQSNQSGQSSNTQGNNVSSSAGGSTFYNQNASSANQVGTSTTQQTGSNPWLKAAGLGAGVLSSLFSDETLKKDIEEVPQKKAIDKIMSLRPVTWKWTKDDSPDMGVIAQDLQKSHPELVHKDPEGSGKLKVNYAGLISELVAGLQFVNKKIEAVS